MKRFNIRTLERLSGVRPGTIRIWELRYGLLRPGRNAGGQRLYTIDEARLLMEVALLCREGGRISALAQLTESERQQRLDRLTDREAVLEAARTRLISALYRFEHGWFEQVLHDMTRRFDATVASALLLKVLELTGIGATRTPDAAEQWALARVRQWLYAQLEATPLPGHGERILLFLPPGGGAEELLLALTVRWRTEGLQAVWLGSGVGLNTIGEYLHSQKTSVLCTVHPVKGLAELAMATGTLLCTLTGSARQTATLSAFERLAHSPFAMEKAR